MAMSELKRTRELGARGQGGRSHRRAPILHAAGLDPFDAVEWETRTALIPGKDGPVVRAARRRVPGVLEPDGDQHRRPEVLPRQAQLARARALGAADDRPRRRHDHRVGHQGRLLRRRRRGRDVPRRAHPPPAPPDGGVQLARSGSTSASRSTRSAAPASSSRSRTTWSRSSTGSARRAWSSAAARARASTCASCARRRSSSPRAATPPGRCRSCAAPTPRPARSSRAARRAGRPRWSS